MGGNLGLVVGLPACSTMGNYVVGSMGIARGASWSGKECGSWGPRRAASIANEHGCSQESEARDETAR